MSKTKRILTLFFFITLLKPTYAITQEANWSTLKTANQGEVLKVYDKIKKRYVTQLKGAGTRSAYILKFKEPNKAETPTIIRWEMNFSEDFVIFIQVNTDIGDYSLIYTPEEENSYLQYGLGVKAKQDGWRSYQRNLQKDLERFIPDGEIFKIESFVIRGSGYIHNVQIAKQSISPSPSSKKIVQKKFNHMPTITLKGKNPILLEIGESYIEQGAKAQDINGDELPINISHQIDIFQEGEYAVIYLAHDHLGNIVVDKRRVIVGNPSLHQTDKTVMALAECENKLEEWEERFNQTQREYLKKNHPKLPPRPGL